MLGSRSAVLYHQAQYRKCLEDAEAAILFGYPPDLEYKLWDR
jgi:hypothetical protein